MRTSLFARWRCVVATMLAAALAVACATRHAAGPPATAVPPAAVTPATPGPRTSSPVASENSLVTQGEARFKSYKCYECHGAHGEGTDDAPDLVWTHLNAGEIAAFLQKPSIHARSAGMPRIPADSPDLQALVAFVLSLKRSP